MKITRRLTWLDKAFIGFDQALKTLTHQAPSTHQPYPAAGVDDAALSPEEARLAAGLMRVNHTGEICAQALYHGQASVSRSAPLTAHLKTAALEEGDHLQWCQQRLNELGSHTSYLNPLWYVGSYFIGATAGLIGDQWSLGFVVETEKQVIRHLSGHLERLPTADHRSRAILSQMETDETKHRDDAEHAGAHPLPAPVKIMMQGLSKVMVKTAYYV